jgi:hypothetical protein
MRKGLQTPIDEVEARGRALLEKFPKADQRALIHYHLADILGQSGVQRPDLIAKHCEEALGLPSLDAARRLRLYSYLGECKQRVDRVRLAADKAAFPKARRDAAAVYLRGLKESIKYGIPEARPGWPRARPFERIMGSPDDPEVKRRLAESRRRYEEFEKEWEQARQDQAAWDNRRALYDQICFLYLARPIADEEMRDLATRALPPDMAKVLFKRFKELKVTVRATNGETAD